MHEFTSTCHTLSEYAIKMGVPVLSEEIRPIQKYHVFGIFCTQIPIVCARAFSTLMRSYAHARARTHLKFVLHIEYYMTYSSTKFQLKITFR